MKIKTILLTMAIGMMAAAGCNYFENPLVDENGEKTPLVLMDFPNFDTKVNVHISDMSGLPIDAANVKFGITGANATELISISGKKQSGLLSTNTGQYHLFLNPSSTLSSSEMYFYGEQTGSYILLPYSTTITSKTTNDIYLTAIGITDAHNTAPQGVSFAGKNTLFSVYRNGVLVNDMFPCNGFPSGLYDYNFDSFGLSLNGKITVGDPADPKEYTNWGLSLLRNGVMTEPKKEVIANNEAVYMMYQPAETETLNKGIKISISGPSDQGQTLSGTLHITQPDGKQIYSINLQTSVPSTFKLKDLNVPKNGIKFVINTNQNSPLVISEESVELTSPVDGKTVSFTATRRDGLTKYDLDAQLIDKEEPTIAFAPTYPFQYKKSGEAQWNSMDLTAGKTSIYINKGADYQFRVSWLGKWYTSGDIPTDPTKIEAFIKKQASSIDEVKITKLEITESNGVVKMRLRASASFVSEL